MNRLLPIALAAVCGCANGPMKTSLRSCSSDSDCGPSQICFEDGCASALDFAARVTPLSVSGHVTQDFSYVGVGRGNSVDLSLLPPAIIEGALQIKQGQTTSSYAAGPFAVEMRGVSTIIPGLAFDHPFSQYVKSGPNYSLALPAGTWTITATADDLDLPPIRAQRSVTSGEVLDPSLLIPGDNLLPVEGALALGAATGGQWPIPAPSFRAQLFDFATRAAASQAKVFAATDHFQLKALSGTNPLVLRVTPMGDAALSFPSKEFLSDSGGLFPDQFELGDFGTPVAVAGTVRDSAGNPVADAELELRGTVGGGGTFSSTARANSLGEYLVQLLPSASGASYSITAHPPQQSQFASATARATVTATSAVLPTVVCPPKYELRGKVLGASQQPLAGVLVQYEGNGAAADPGVSKGDVQTDGKGEFAVRVEPGSYRVAVKPGADLRLPWSARRISVKGNTDLQISVSKAREVLGMVRVANADGTSAAVAHAIVAIYRLQPGYSDPSQPPLLIYEALSDSLGQFKLILPDSSSP